MLAKMFVLSAGRAGGQLSRRCSLWRHGQRQVVQACMHAIVRPGRARQQSTLQAGARPGPARPAPAQPAPPTHPSSRWTPSAGRAAPSGRRHLRRGSGPACGPAFALAVFALSPSPAGKLAPAAGSRGMPCIGFRWHACMIAASGALQARTGGMGQVISQAHGVAKGPALLGRRGVGRPAGGARGCRTVVITQAGTPPAWIRHPQLTAWWPRASCWSFQTDAWRL